jgi:hypothetical protein
MKTFLLVTAWTLAISLNAKQLDLKKVSDDSNWIMHMDFESMRSSEIGSFIEDSLESIPEMENRVKDVQNKFGIDLKEVSNLTVFGTGEKDKGIGILENGVDASVVTEVTRARDYIVEKKVGKKTIFSTNKGRRPMAFSVLKKGKIVFGPDRDYVLEGIHLANNKGKGTKAHPLLQNLKNSIIDPGFLLFADVEQIAGYTDLNSKMSLMVNKIDSCGIVIGDEEGAVKMIAFVQANSEESAINMENMIRGALAMMEMKMAKEERMSPLFEGHKLVREHSLIKLDVNFSVLAIIDLIKKEMKKKV